MAYKQQGIYGCLLCLSAVQIFLKAKWAKLELWITVERGNFDWLMSAMSRAWRIEYKGAFYHLLSRGNEQRDIFEDEMDRNIFLDTIGGFFERFDIFEY